MGRAQWVRKSQKNFSSFSMDIGTDDGGVHSNKLELYGISAGPEFAESTVHSLQPVDPMPSV